MDLFTGGYKSVSPLAVHIKESSLEVWMGSKSGLLQALIGSLKIAQSRFGCIIEDPQRPNHSSLLLDSRVVECEDVVH